jgi:bacillithiol biosynthesis cysteine-adding enzyme BshC
VSVEQLDLSRLGFARPFVELARGEGRAADLLGGGAAGLERSAASTPAALSGATARALEQHAQDLQAPEASLTSLAALRAGALAVVTGQQPGLLGGPLFTLHKAATAIRAAVALQDRLGRPVVPVLWVESEDHDLREVNQLTLVDREESLQTRGIPQLEAGPPVGRIAFGQGAQALLDWLEQALPDGTHKPAAMELARAALQPAERFGSAFARCMLGWLGHRGLVICDPGLEALKTEAASVIRRVLENPNHTVDALKEGERQVKAARYPVQAALPDDRLPVFRVRDGRRQRVAVEQAAAALEELERDPQRFSPGVHLRPVIQDFLLPTVAEVVGPSEAAYQAQLGPLYRLLERPRPAVLPRASMTLVAPRLRRHLERYGFDFGQLRQPAGELERRAARVRAPEDLQVAGGQARRTLEQAFDDLAPLLKQLDASLDASLEGHKKRAAHALEGLIRKAEGAQRRADTLARRHVAMLQGRLAPAGGLQERGLTTLPFLAEHGSLVIDSVLQHADPSTGTHLIVDL